MALGFVFIGPVALVLVGGVPLRLFGPARAGALVLDRVGPI
jgi:hypothetical protein